VNFNGLYFVVGFKGEVVFHVDTLWGTRAVIEGLDWIPGGENPYPYQY